MPVAQGSSGLDAHGVLLFSEGPGSSPGLSDLSCGLVCGGVKPGAEGGGGEPGVPRLPGRSVPGQSPVVSPCVF